MPDEVTARLDDVIAGLVGEQSGTVSDTTVVPLRRKWPAVLLAAATVAAVGFGVTQMLGNQSSPDSADAGDASTQSQENGDATGRPDASMMQSPDSSSPERSGKPENLSAAKAAALDQIPGLDFTSPDSGTDLYTQDQAPGFVSELNARCGPPSPVAGARYAPAKYRGREALVVLVPATPNSQRVDVYVCGPSGGKLVTSATVAAGP